jgi:hypothetical protein
MLAGYVIRNCGYRGSHELWLLWCASNVVAVTSEEERGNCCIDGPLIAELIHERYWIKFCIKLTTILCLDNYYCQFYCPFCKLVQQ